MPVGEYMMIDDLQDVHFVKQLGRHPGRIPEGPPGGPPGDTLGVPRRIPGGILRGGFWMDTCMLPSCAARFQSMHLSTLGPPQGDPPGVSSWGSPGVSRWVSLGVSLGVRLTGQSGRMRWTDPPARTHQQDARPMRWYTPSLLWPLASDRAQRGDPNRATWPYRQPGRASNRPSR